jgi:hypothetical protein
MTGKLMERCYDGVEDPAAEEALWGVCQERIITSVSEAASRRSRISFQRDI